MKSQFLRSAVLLTLMLGISGCSTPALEITTPLVKPTYNAKSKGMKANAMLTHHVRAYSKTDKAKTEIRGAACTIRTPYYAAKLSTPGHVELPSYADKTPPATLSCTHGGKTQTKTVNPFNLTVQQRTANSGGGILPYLIVVAATKKSNSVYSYPRFSTVFEDK